jgi:hypothetical protein
MTSAPGPACPDCGRPMRVDQERHEASCDDCRLAFPLVGAPSFDVDEGPVIVRTYRARNQNDAAAEFAEDARNLALLGYFPASQSWAAGQWGCGAWLVALLLCVALIGLLVFVYMLIVKPHGTLTVSYVRQEPEVRQSRR